MMDARDIAIPAAAPRWRLLQGLPPEKLADFLARELDYGLPVDWAAWLREKVPTAPWLSPNN